MDADAIRDVFAEVLAVRVRRMFGGHGIYDGELMFALAFDGEIYLKTNEATRLPFAAAGSAPFVYRARGRERDLGYWKLPEEALDDADLLRDWVGLALQAARAQGGPAGQATRLATSIASSVTVRLRPSRLARIIA